MWRGECDRTFLPVIYINATDEFSQSKGECKESRSESEAEHTKGEEVGRL